MSKHKEQSAISEEDEFCATCLRQDTDVCMTCSYISSPSGKISLPSHFMAKPPLGVIPRWLLDEKRLCELSTGIERYVDAGKAIPLEWIYEYNQIIKRQCKKKK